MAASAEMFRAREVYRSVRNITQSHLEDLTVLDITNLGALSIIRILLRRPTINSIIQIASTRCNPSPTQP